MTNTTSLEKLLKKDRLIVIGGLLFVILTASLYTIFGAGLVMGEGWALPYFILIFFMWWIMMIAMMIPSAAPTILLFAALKRQNKSTQNLYLHTGLFLIGYLSVWGLFSLLVTFAQWQLELNFLMSAMGMAVTDKYLGAGILLFAGVYQFSVFKQACLKHCRDPIRFLTEHRRTGRFGPFLMGLEHGIFCLGCCWFLMGLLFFGGVMNLYWIAGIAIFILVEKLTPIGHWVGYGVGIGLIIASGYLFIY